MFMKSYPFIIITRDVGTFNSRSFWIAIGRVHNVQHSNIKACLIRIIRDICNMYAPSLSTA